MVTTTQAQGIIGLLDLVVNSFSDSASAKIGRAKQLFTALIVAAGGPPIVPALTESDADALIRLIGDSLVGDVDIPAAQILLVTLGQTSTGITVQQAQRVIAAFRQASLDISGTPASQRASVQELVDSLVAIMEFSPTPV
jgi:hypothetical protein